MSENNLTGGGGGGSVTSVEGVRGALTGTEAGLGGINSLY